MGTRTLCRNTKRTGNPSDASRSGFIHRRDDGRNGCQTDKGYTRTGSSHCPSTQSKCFELRTNRRTALPASSVSAKGIRRLSVRCTPDFRQLRRSCDGRRYSRCFRRDIRSQTGSQHIGIGIPARAWRIKHAGYDRSLLGRVPGRIYCSYR